MSALNKAFRDLRAFALDYPETREDKPWGETAIKVRGKSFVFLHGEGGELMVTLKLSDRHEFALEYPFASPSRYGLGKSGWVSCRFSRKDKPPLDLLKAWIDESYRLVAPKKLVASLGNGDPEPLHDRNAMSSPASNARSAWRGQGTQRAPRRRAY